MNQLTPNQTKEDATEFLRDLNRGLLAGNPSNEYLMELLRILKELSSAIQTELEMRTITNVIQSFTPTIDRGIRPRRIKHNISLVEIARKEDS